MKSEQELIEKHNEIQLLHAEGYEKLKQDDLDEKEAEEIALALFQMEAQTQLLTWILNDPQTNEDG